MLTESLISIPFPVIGRTFLSADFALAAGKMRKNKLLFTDGFRYDLIFIESQAASCKYFQSQNRLGSLKRVTERCSKSFSNFKGASKTMSLIFSSTKKQKFLKAISTRAESTLPIYHYKPSKNTHLVTQSL